MREMEFFETPQLVPDEDWNLSNPRANLLRARSITKHVPEILEDFGLSELLHLGGNVGGQIALISKTSRLLEYYVHYEIGDIPSLGHCATQVKLWRSLNASVIGFETKELMFENHLWRHLLSWLEKLKSYSAVGVWIYPSEGSCAKLVVESDDLSEWTYVIPLWTQPNESGS